MILSIGPVALSSPVLLAPMSGVTDQPFRRLVRDWGVGLVISEMIASQAMVRESRQSMKMSTGCAEEYPMAVQLAGTDPAIMAEAARINEDRGAAIIDINFGCPVKKVVAKAAGSALMRDEALAARIMEAVVAAVSVPVTVKMRTGWDDSSRNAPRLAQIAREAGVRLVTVHGRTREQMYQGRADWAFIRRVKEACGLPVVANGDVTTPEEAEECLALSGADGVMIGRGSYGRPWFPKQVHDYLTTGRAGPEPGTRAVGATALEHYDAILTHYGIAAGTRIARKHLAWYGKGLPDATGFRAAVHRLDDPGAVRATILAHFMEQPDRMAA